jgi:hypothetical protein
MSDSTQSNDLAYAKMFADAWSKPDVLNDLTSSDPATVRATFAKYGINYDDGVNVHVVQGTPKDRYVVLPPKAYVDGGEKDAAGKCYGPACGFLCGPF